MPFILQPADCLAVRQYLGATQNEMPIILKLKQATIWRACELGQGKNFSVEQEKSNLFCERLIPLAQYRQDLIANIAENIADYGGKSVVLPYYDDVGEYQKVQAKKWREPPTLDKQSPEMAEWICSLIGRHHTYKAFCAEMHLKHGVRVISSKKTSDEIPNATWEEITLISQSLGVSLTRLSEFLNIASYMKRDLNPTQLQRINDFGKLLMNAHDDLKAHDNYIHTDLCRLLCNSGKKDKGAEYNTYDISPRYFEILKLIKHFQSGAEIMTKLANLPIQAA